ncbi:hypothetical protein JCM8097_007065 [Rhodosporidiobolus ruineniae]
MSSWADVAKGPVPADIQGTPDQSLLTTPADIAPDRAASPNTAAHASVETDHIAAVDRDEFEKLKRGVEHAEEPHSVDDEFEAARRHQAERDAEEQQARLKAQAQAELKQTTDKVEAVAESVEDKGKDALHKAEKKGKEVEREVKDKWDEGKKEAKQFADKAEKEVKKDAKKLQKKASEVEKEGRALAKQYPYAASGLVGVVNLALIAIPTYFAVKHWHEPRWDRRVVSAVVVGLSAVFGAESALGFFEYKQEKQGK